MLVWHMLNINITDISFHKECVLAILIKLFIKLSLVVAQGQKYETSSENPTHSLLISFANHYTKRDALSLNKECVLAILLYHSIILSDLLPFKNILCTSIKCDP